MAQFRSKLINWKQQLLSRWYESFIENLEQILSITYCIMPATVKKYFLDSCKSTKSKSALFFSAKQLLATSLVKDFYYFCLWNLFEYLAPFKQYVSLADNPKGLENNVRTLTTYKNIKLLLHTKLNFFKHYTGSIKQIFGKLLDI